MNQSTKLPLSVVIISLNEEVNLPRAIASVAEWVDEVLVYDSGSKDKTVDVAANLGAKVVQGEWLGFGRTKQKATNLAKYSWVLSLDSDEEVSLELRKEIMIKFSSLDENTAYQVPRISYFLGRWIKHGGWYPDYQTRLFNKKINNWNEEEIHEKVQANLQSKLVSNLNHYVFRSIEDQVSTNNKYSTLQAFQMNKAGKKFSWVHFFTKPKVKFCECYILKLGFLDGWPGFVIAVSAAYSVFMKWSKLYEIERLNQKS